MPFWRSIERRGIEPVGAAERHGHSADLGWVWFAANIGILSLVFGAVISALGLDVLQAIGATVIGSAGSFMLVGLVAVAGKWGGMPTLTLSRAAFGRLGNLGPTALGWVNVLGWEVVTSVIAAWSLAALIGLVAVGIPTRLIDTLSLLAVVATSLALGVLGHHAIVRFQRVAAYVFGGLTLPVLAFLVAKANWHVVATSHPAPFGAVAAAASIVAAGTGISWVNLGADYSRYLPHSERARSIVWWVALASTLPTVVLIMAGYLLASDVGGLAGALDPIRTLGSALPAWMAAPYLLVAVGGMLAETDMASYSSGLGLLALGVKVRRSRTMFIDAGVVLGAGLVIMLGSAGFLGPFESFLEVLASGLAAWAGVFLADMWLARRAASRHVASPSPTQEPFTHLAGNHVRDRLARHYQSPPRVGLAGTTAWAAGTAVALAATVCPWFKGPLAIGVLAEANVGYVLGFVLAAALFLVVAKSTARSTTTLASQPPLCEDAAVSGIPETRASAVPGVLETRVPAPPRPQRLVLVGSILVDILVYVDQLPDRGGDTFAGARRISSGGGFNVLSAACRLGMPVAYAGRVGDGVFGRQVARDLESEGIPILLGFTRGEDTGFDIGIVEEDGERTFLTAPGTESRLDEAEIARVHLSPGDAVYVSGYDLLYPVSGPTIASWLGRLPSDHMVIVDPGPIAPVGAPNHFHEVLGRVDLLSMNAREASLLARTPDPATAAREISHLIAPGGTVVVRMGAAGCVVAVAGAEPMAVPGFPAIALDTTGAGDVHAGALIARLANGDDMVTAAKAANAAAAWSVEHAGGATGPRPEDLESLLDVTRGWGANT